MAKQNSLKWRVTKTGMLVHSVRRSTPSEMPRVLRNGQVVMSEFLTAITEHGNKIHFPPSFLRHGEPKHDQVTAAEQLIADRNIKMLQSKFSGKRDWAPKPFNFTDFFDQM